MEVRARVMVTVRARVYLDRGVRVAVRVSVCEWIMERGEVVKLCL